MAAPSLNSTVIARLAQAAYGLKLGNATMAEAIAAASAVNGGVAALMNTLYARDFGGQTPAAVAATIVTNIGVPAAAVADATAYITGQLTAAAPAARGAALIDVLQLWSSLGNNAVVGAAVRQFNADIASAVAYGNTVGTLDFDLKGGVFNVDGTAAAGVMRITGNHNVRIDITRQTDQVTGLDLNRNGVIEFNGKENVNPTSADDGKNFTVIDAYSRNALDATDLSKNYQGTIWFDGSGFAGNGTSTNGNIFLGGIGSDIALGGIGNDFMAGGGARTTGVVQGQVVWGGLDGAGDDLAGGRNADFFFGEISRLSATDGNNSRFSGGTTADNTSNSGGGAPAGVNAAGGLGTQDNDWLLLEASDDDEPVAVTLNEGSVNANAIARNVAAASGSGFTIADMESINASGNLYGFLNNTSTVVGARSYDGYGDGFVAGAENYGRGSTAQLQITGSAANNIVIAGYDNDTVDAGTGNDLIFGGDLRFLIQNKNNPNLLDSKGGLNLNVAGGLVNDGRDVLNGGDGSDSIVFEADGGTINGGGDAGKASGQANRNADGSSTFTLGPATGSVTDDKPYSGPRFQSQGDTLWVTDFSMGRVTGATAAGEATGQSEAMSKLTTDSVFRIDLGGGGSFKNYGGNNATTSQDTSNYVGSQRVAMSNMESVNVTGLGAIDYLAAGSNAPELKFNNQQNYAGFAGTVDLRGTGRDNALLANTGNDTLEGRGGDDVISGGAGNDRMLMSFGDGIDWFARPVDANGDGLWDTTGGLVVASGVAWGQDFRAAAAATAGVTTLVVDFGSTVLNGVDTFVATFQVRIDGKDFGTTIPIATLAAAKTLAEVAAIVNTNFNAQDKSVTAVVGAGNTIEIRAVDPVPGDPLPTIGTTAANGFFVTGQAAGVGTYQAKGSILGQGGTNLDDDRLVIKSYQSRAINLGTDQTTTAISQAAQMVANFTTGGSTIAQANTGYTFRLYIDSVQEGDTVTATINGTKYAYTLLAGENAENAATKLAAVITNFLDKDAASGTVAATAVLNSDIDNAGVPDSFDVGADQSALTITQTFANNSATFMDISAAVTRADGATPFGSVNLHNQTNTMAQLLGFDGRNGALNAQDKDATPVVLFQGRNTGNTTMSLLLTAKDAGGALNGMDSNVDADDPAGGFINGDDLLFGGNGNDVIDGKTGADRIMMSKGTDTVEGGNNSTRGNGSTQVYQDVLQAEERTFGDGTSFKVTLNGAIGAAGVGKGTVAAIKADLTPTGDVTTFSGIELVRVLENNRNSELDVKALSDSIAAAVVTGPNGGILAGNNVAGAPNERLVVNLTQTPPNPSTTYTIDNNADGDTDDDGESYTATAVLGIESVTSGNANDTVIVDQSQANANNRFSLGAQQDNLKTFVKGTDTVVYQHGGLAAADRPVFTVSVLGAGSSTVGMTAGALGTATFTDTLTSVEVVDVAAGATNSGNRDVLNVAAVNGATINYGADISIGSSLGGNVSPVNSLAIKDGNTLDSGSVAANSALSSELVNFTGILTLERVVGSAGDDRVVVANAMGASGLAATKIGVASYLGAASTVNAIDNGLYRFDLADGKNDTVDYRQETGNVAVVVNYDGATDTVIVDGDNNGALATANQDRVDQATNVERYFASLGVARIDLSAATSDATVQFSAESKVNSNEYFDPNGRANPVVDNQVRGISVTKADATVVARFMNADAGDPAAANPAALWDIVEGSGFAETVNFTNFEIGSAETLNLKGGANVVSYNQITQPNIEITASIDPGSNKYTITPNGGAADTVTIDRAAGGGLTIIATNDSDDTIANTFAAPTKLTGAANTLTDLSGTTAYGYHLIDLNAGQVVEDVAISIGGTYSTAGYLNNVTKIQQFENATGGAQQDRIFGNASNNVLNGAAGNDIVSGGGGGDTLTGGANDDRFTYGTLSDGAPFTGGAAMTAAAADSVTDFDAAGNDVLVVDAGLFGQLYQNVTNSIDVAPIAINTNGADLNAGAVFLVKDAVAANANLLVLADVAAKIGTIAGTAIGDGKFFGAGGANEASQAAVFIVGAGAGNQAGVYIWRDANDDANVTAGELSLVALIANQGVVAAGADAAGEFRSADTVVRVSGTGGQQTFNLNNADQARTELVYTSTAQSRIGFVDNLNGFAGATDRIDLTGIFVGQTLAQSAIAAVRNTAAAGNNTGVSVAGFFNDGGTNRAVVVEEFAGGANTRVFVDANLDGNFDIATDLVIDFAGIGLGIAANTFIYG